jgi:O-antigen ligase
MLLEQDLLYAGQRLGHPLSIDPAATAAAAGFMAVFLLFSLGLAAELSRPTPRPAGATTGARPQTALFVLCRNIALVAAGVAVMALFQAATFNGRIYGFWMPEGGSTNVFGPFVNRNHFAGWMALATCLAGGCLGAYASRTRWRGGAEWRRVLLWLESTEGTRVALVTTAIAVMGIAVVWSLSRSGIVAYAAGMGLLVVAGGRIQSGRRRIAALLTLVVAGSVLWRDTGVLAHWFGRSETLAWRIALWKDSLAPLSDFAFLGSGLNTYEKVMLGYPLQHPWINPVHAHNEYLQMAIEGGLLAAGPFVLMLLAIAREMLARVRDEQSPERYWIRLGAIAGLMAAVVQAGADFSMRLPGVAMLASVLVAIAMHRAPHLNPARSTP